ncbi:hypothetical protein XACM_1123 [Xanthomonas euvesicatoria pv. citrumelo F1]|nr:hypothetical protein XACM_1123 [Xanthomonas euvesicatoria pv. citrumelo F1]
MLRPSGPRDGTAAGLAATPCARLHRGALQWRDSPDTEKAEPSALVGACPAGFCALSGFPLACTTPGGRRIGGGSDCGWQSVAWCSERCRPPGSLGALACRITVATSQLGRRDGNVASLGKPADRPKRPSPDPRRAALTTTPIKPPRRSAPGRDRHYR